MGGEGSEGGEGDEGGEDGEGGKTSKTSLPDDVPAGRTNGPYEDPPASPVHSAPFQPSPYESAIDREQVAPTSDCTEPSKGAPPVIVAPLPQSSSHDTS